MRFGAKSAAILVVCLCFVFEALGANGNVGLPRFPSISPDGSTVVFSFRGDLYKVPSGGGHAVRLTSHPFNDLASAWSRDGKRIAFGSDRSGSFNIHLMNADGTSPRQLTQTDRNLALSGFGLDEEGKEVLTLDSVLEPEWFRSQRSYVVSTSGGEIREVFGAYGSFPHVSPDGTKVLFNRGTSGWARRGYRGADNRDVWMYDRKQKSYTRLTGWKGNDGRAKWIDNDTFVYASDREDNCVNLYMMSLGEDEKAAKRLTRFKEIDVEDFDVAFEAKVAVFSAWDSLYTLDLAKPTEGPRALTLTADEDEQDDFAMKDVGRLVSEAALSPDGKTMAYVAYGEIYVRSTEPKSPTRRVTNNGAREQEIVWSPDGARLYFVSDLSGRNGIYAARVRLTRDEVKKQVEALRKESTKLIPERTEAEVGDASEPTTKPSTQATSQPSSQPATQVASTQATTRPAVAAATTQPTEASRWKEAIAFTVEPFLVTDEQNTSPSPSPDGKWLAFRRGNGNLMLKSLPDGAVRTLVESWSPSMNWRWSPDARHIAYQDQDENYNSDVWIVPVEGEGKPVNITRHPRNDFNPRWSLDGKVLSFVSERVNREFDVWMVYLDKDLEALTTPELDAYYKGAVAAAKKREPVKERTTPSRQTRAAATMPATVPATQAAATRPAETMPTTRVVEEQRPGRQLDLDDAYLRLRQVTRLSGNELDNELSPGGDVHLFTATIAGERGVFTIDRDSPAPKRVAGLSAANIQHVSLTGDQVVFVEQGRAGVIKLPANSVEYFDIADRIRVSLRAQSEQKFLEASRIVGTMWYDPKLNNLDWDALTKRYLDLARQARTDHEFDHVANKFIGELNGSHLGINTPDPVSPNARPVGRLGIRYQPVADGVKVTKVYGDGPAGKGPMKLVEGDVITAIDLEPLKGSGGENQPHEVTFSPKSSASTLDALLAGKVGKETIVTVRRTTTDGESREVNLLITPISYAAYADLHYKEWRLSTAKKVEEWSGGKVGYIHVQGMNQESLDVFERDLYAAAHGKKGLLIDVRNNGGGSTADLMLASIMAPNHAYTVARGMDPETQKGYPTDRLFISRYTLPINMLCNEKSFSNAEIISHAFKTLKRGTLVGQQTAGGVISTGGTTLLDGTTVRIPFRGWHLPDGTNMELHGAMPDLLVEQTPEHEEKEDDRQLRAAVHDLLKRL